MGTNTGKLLARRERVQAKGVLVGYEKRRNDEDSFKALKNQVVRAPNDANGSVAVIALNDANG